MDGLDEMGSSSRVEPTGEEPYTVVVDPAARVIRLVIRGAVAVAEVEPLLARIGAAIGACREQSGFFKLLVDQRGQAAQSPDVSERLWTAHARMCGPLDRLAVVVGSCVAKGRLRRRFDGTGSKAFLSIEAAEMWLGAWS